MLPKTLPQSNTKAMAARILWFMASLSNGSAQQWLGSQTTQTMQKTMIKNENSCQA